MFLLLLEDRLRDKHEETFLEERRRCGGRGMLGAELFLVDGCGGGDGFWMARASATTRRACECLANDVGDGERASWELENVSGLPCYSMLAVVTGRARSKRAYQTAMVVMIRLPGSQTMMVQVKGRRDTVVGCCSWRGAG